MLLEHHAKGGVAAGPHQLPSSAFVSTPEDKLTTHQTLFLYSPVDTIDRQMVREKKSILSSVISLFAGSAHTSGMTPIRATLGQMWWRTISPSSTASGLESVL